jgi:putative ubiquitin-RnfH superfamily antitoxin RatB of RatAB toxin-antitoxin module
MCSLSVHERHTVTESVEQQGLTAIKSKFDFEMCREEGGVGVHKQGAQAAGGADP